MDLISDFLSALKNAAMRGKQSVSVPYTKLLQSIGELLVKEGYLSGVEKNTRKGASTSQLVAMITYIDDEPRLEGVRRISKPSRRVYTAAGDIHPVKSGHGTLVLSTPEGLMTGNDARKKNIGGEALFEIW